MKKHQKPSGGGNTVINNTYIPEEPDTNNDIYIELNRYSSGRYGQLNKAKSDTSEYMPKLKKSYTVISETNSGYKVSLVNIPKHSVIMLAGYNDGQLEWVQTRKTSDNSTEEFITTASADYVSTLVLGPDCIFLPVKDNK